MNSTGNDIVSLNAIDITRTRQQRFYSKILAGSESILYNQYQDDLAFETFVWILWSVKESAYKFLQRTNPNLVFSPTRCFVTQLEIPVEYQILNPSISILEGMGFDGHPACKSIVTVGSETLYSSSIITRGFIFSVVSRDNDFESTGWGIKRIDDAGSDNQSAEVRTFLLEKLKKELPLHQLQVHKNAHGCPVLVNGAEKIDACVSLAHHDHWVGYSYQLDSVMA
ncbi:MAG TPA: 4'-phosphopantetheinyl transferase superfamily protein [Mucilaginibacter sp.]|jgi:phosphopantetheinyl transferase (holo-ACP synthase)|nr:4'-phosphopantetheinyl transferase superfamily protein [Mucilaginibacter sp.]